MRISYGKNVYGLNEIAAVTRQLRKTTQMGSSVSKFEKKISQFLKKEKLVQVRKCYNLN